MQYMMDFVVHSDYCMKLLMVISIASITVMVAKIAEYKKIGEEVRALDRITGLGQTGQLPEGIIKKTFGEIAAYGNGASLEPFIQTKLAALDGKLMARVTILGLIATLAPMIGLIGTFIGVFHVFEGVSSLGLTDPKAVAHGIKEVLLDTVGGLVVAIPAMVAYKSFEVHASKVSLAVEEKLYRLLGGVSAPEQGEQP
ncbi:MAG: MotA/TolQ/ExbB proton channel family protein [Nitrospinae bacterium]|nr:MotA/TolQ/ExbB proton channel family protein [Nitrospinota bacterium]